MHNHKPLKLISNKKSFVKDKIADPSNVYFGNNHFSGKKLLE